MIEIFRNWIVALLCLSILIVIIQLVIPKTTLRKYIYTLIGIITVITIISPVVDLLKKQDIKESIADVLSSFNTNDAAISVNSSDLEEKKTGLVKVQFIDSIKQDIKDKLESKNITVTSIHVSVDDNYDITKLEIKILKSKTGIVSVNEIVKYVNILHFKYQSNEKQSFEELKYLFNIYCILPYELFVKYAQVLWIKDNMNYLY